MNKHLSRKKREECWSAAAYMQGRDPSRWRLDTLGNPVLKYLHNCSGPLCYTYDSRCNIQQFCLSKSGGSEDHPCTLPVSMSDLEMDMVERGVYGDVKR